MSCLRRPCFVLCAVLGATLITGCTVYRSPDQGLSTDNAAVEVTGGVNVSRAESVRTGYPIPDGRGGHILMPGNPRPALNPAMENAQELRLKVKELAAQMLETRPNDGLIGMVALPTSFVNLNNFAETNPLGRYLAEAMYYEFNQRGVPVREYRMDGSIHFQPGGEFALTRNLPALKVSQTWGAILVGTYLKDKGTVLVNARLVRPDGMVLRTAQLVLMDTPLITRLTNSQPFAPGTLQIVSEPSVGKTPAPKRSSTRSSSSRKTSAPPMYSQSDPAQAPTRQETAPAQQPQTIRPATLDTGMPMPGPAKNI